MNPDGELRRLIPPPRRRPGLLAVLVRWRAELLLVGVLAGLWYLLGGEVVAAFLVATAALVLVAPPVRQALLGVLQAMIATHRVRSGLVQAGVADRRGRPPWIVAARPRDDVVLVSLWLNSGTTLGDLRAAAPVVATACGAADVQVLRRSRRQDRAVLEVTRPRWGWLSR